MSWVGATSQCAGQRSLLQFGPVFRAGIAGPLIVVYIACKKVSRILPQFIMLRRKDSVSGTSSNSTIASRRWA